MHVRITHIDGKLPNLALMAISGIHRLRGDTIHFTRDVERGLFEENYDRVYGSCIFRFSHHRLQRFLNNFPGATVGGTGFAGSDLVSIGGPVTVESAVGEPTLLDYSIYPEFSASLGFTQRGCRLSCRFCVVPERRQKPFGEDNPGNLARPRPPKETTSPRQRLFRSAARAMETTDSGDRGRWLSCLPQSGHQCAPDR